MQQQLASAIGFGGGVAGVFVAADVAVEEEGLAIANQAVAILELRLAGAQGFDLAAEQGHSGFEALENLVVMARLAVLGNDFFPGEHGIPMVRPPVPASGAVNGADSWLESRSGQC